MAEAPRFSSYRGLRFRFYSTPIPRPNALSPTFLLAASGEMRYIPRLLAFSGR